MVAQAWNPSTQARQECCKVEASLGCVVSSRLARVRIKGPVSLPTEKTLPACILDFVVWDFSTGNSAAVAEAVCGRARWQGEDSVLPHLQ